jgi:hypothetical protein
MVFGDESIWFLGKKQLGGSMALLAKHVSKKDLVIQIRRKVIEIWWHRSKIISKDFFFRLH